MGRWLLGLTAPKSYSVVLMALCIFGASGLRFSRALCYPLLLDIYLLCCRFQVTVRKLPPYTLKTESLFTTCKMVVFSNILSQMANDGSIRWLFRLTARFWPWVLQMGIAVSQSVPVENYSAH